MRRASAAAPGLIVRGQTPGVDRVIQHGLDLAQPGAGRAAKERL